MLACEVADALDMDHVNGKLVTPVAVMLDFVCHAEALRRDPYPVFDPKAVEFSDHLLALKRASRSVAEFIERK